MSSPLLADLGASHPTRHWHALDDGRVQCDVCPRACKLRDGQRGLCFVRANEGGGIVLTTYGRSSGFCVDPVEKKPLNHFLPGTPILSFGTAGCNLACKFCFHADTLIATSDGMRRIAELFGACGEYIGHGDGQVGFPESLDVWTRQGRLARVAKVFAHPYSGDLLSLKASCCPPILLTPNHRVFAAHRANPADVQLIAAGQLTSEHFLVIPKRQAGGSVRIAVDEQLAKLARGAHLARSRRTPARELAAALRSERTSAELGRALGYHPAYVRKLRGQLGRGVFVADEQPRPVTLRVAAGRVRFAGEHGAGIPAILDLTEELAWLLGMYCAEGSVSAHPQRPNSYHVVFSFGHHEQHLVDRTMALLTDVIGARPVVIVRRTTVTVECRSSSVARLFEALCGRGARRKRVPVQLPHAPEPVIRAFLDGYLAGDGHYGETHVAANTVSRELALGLYELGLHIDLLPTFFTQQPDARKRIEGREVNQSTTFIVKFTRRRYDRRERLDSERAGWRDAGDHFLVPLRQVERVPYDGIVYNLEVDDADHSYLAPFIAVSNCQNWDISKSRQMDTLMDRATPEAIARAAEAMGCRSVAFTYNDPVVFHEYAIDVAQACRERGVMSVAVTAGYVCPEPRAEFYRHMDAANVDLKAFSERFYHDVSAARLAPVLETLEYIRHETRTWLELTTLLIPGENDSDEELERMTQWVVERLGPDVPMHFTAFHPDYKMLDRPPTPPATLARARRIALKNGVRYAYTGNTHDAEGQSTYCHGCGAVLVGRDWYTLSAWNLTDEGACKACGTRCAGVFDGKPGRWGARRLPVALGVGRP